MFVVNFGRIGSGAGLVARKLWVFEKCFPINISNERYSYSSEEGPDRRDVEFSFRRYQVVLAPGQIDAALQIGGGRKGSGWSGLFKLPGNIASGAINSGRGILGLD